MTMIFVFELRCLVVFFCAFCEKALVDYAVFLVEKGHRWSMGDFDSQNDPTNAGSASETPQPDEPREQPVQTRDTTTSAANSVGEEAGDPSAHISSRGRPRGLPHDDRMQSRLGNWFDQVDLRLQVKSLWHQIVANHIKTLGISSSCIICFCFLA